MFVVIFADRLTPRRQSRRRFCFELFDVNNARLVKTKTKLGAAPGVSRSNTASPSLPPPVDLTSASTEPAVRPLSPLPQPPLSADASALSTALAVAAAAAAAAAAPPDDRISSSAARHASSGPSQAVHPESHDNVSSIVPAASTRTWRSKRSHYVFCVEDGAPALQEVRDWSITFG